MLPHARVHHSSHLGICYCTTMCHKHSRYHWNCKVGVVPSVTSCLKRQMVSSGRCIGIVTAEIEVLPQCPSWLFAFRREPDTVEIEHYHPWKTKTDVECLQI